MESIGPDVRRLLGRIGLDAFPYREFPDEPRSGPPSPEPAAPRGTRIEAAGFVAGIGACVAAAALAIATPLEPPDQAVLGACVLAAALVARRFGGERGAAAALALSAIVSARWLLWRALALAGAGATPADRVAGAALLAIEAVAAGIVGLGAARALLGSRRRPVPLPDSPGAWPTVDAIVSCEGGDPEAVRMLAHAAVSLDWPRDRLRVAIAGEAWRDDLRAVAAEVGATFVDRAEREPGAGEAVDAALAALDGEFVVAVTPDRVPVRCALQLALGWGVADPRIGLVRVPDVPGGGSHAEDVPLAWRRSALREIGGVGGVGGGAEDLAAARLRASGWTVATVLAPVVAPLPGFPPAGRCVGRMRALLGRVAAFRTFVAGEAPGRLPARVVAAASLLEPLGGLVPAALLLAPAALLLAGLDPFHAPAGAVVAWTLPHLLVGLVACHPEPNALPSRIGRAAFLLRLLPTAVRLLAHPRPDGPAVRAAADREVRAAFADRISGISATIAALGVAGILAAAWRVQSGAPLDSPAFLMLWCMAGLLLLALPAPLGPGAGVPAARDRPLRVAATLSFADGSEVSGWTERLDPAGARVTAAGSPRVRAGLPVRAAFAAGRSRLDLDARIGSWRDGAIDVEFEAPPPADLEAFERAVVSRADAALDEDAGAAASHVAFGAVAALVLAVAMACAGAGGDAPAGAVPEAARAWTPYHGEGWRHTPLSALGIDPAALHAAGAADVRIPIVARGDEAIVEARLVLGPVATERGLPRGLARLWVSCSGLPVARVAPDDLASGAPFAIPVDRHHLIDRQELVLRWALDDPAAPIPPGSWSILESGRLEERVVRLPLPDDPSLLPLPFVDPAVDREPVVQVAFETPPGPDERQVADDLAAWLGALAGGRPVAVRTSIGRPPPGHVVVVARRPIASAGFADRPDAPPYKALVVEAPDGDGMRVAAAALLGDAALRPAPLQRSAGSLARTVALTLSAALAFGLLFPASLGPHARAVRRSRAT